jgi:sulfite exporter TauE/SafE
LALAINSGVSYFGLLNSDDAVALFTRFSGMTIMLLSLWFVVRERRSLARQECCEPTIVGLSDLQAIDSLWKQVRFSFLMGVGGGLVPCGTALSMYLASVAQGEFERGILSILIFSAGILVSVTLTTWILLHSLRVVKFLQKPGLEKKLLWLRFAIMFGTGFVLVFF